MGRYLRAGAGAITISPLAGRRPSLQCCWTYPDSSALIGKPLWSRATGWIHLEDLGDGRTRVHFREMYEAFNPILRALLERRVHRFISKDNDRFMKSAIEMRDASSRESAS